MIALGIGLEEYEYPYPVHFLPLTSDLQPVSMAYMDIPPSTEQNGKTVVLFHGKAFGCYYFRNVIEALTGAGYRVIAPDQIGWGKYPHWARSAALTFQMIYQQPVRYEYHLIAPPTLLIVGAEDHVVPLGQYAQPADAARLGDFVALSAAAVRDIPLAKRVVIPECGHIPHLEHPSSFCDELLPFLES
jgi:pimeloyl-ACP methyl ester carboxylesterase